jgi:hypothetical protein
MNFLSFFKKIAGRPNKRKRKAPANGEVQEPAPKVKVSTLD